MDCVKIDCSGGRYEEERWQKQTLPTQTVAVSTQMFNFTV